MNIGSVKSVEVEDKVVLPAPQDAVVSKVESAPVKSDPVIPDPVVSAVSESKDEVEKSIPSKELESGIQKANEIMNALEQDLKFVYDDRGTQPRIIVKVVDSAGKTIRQYPPEEMLKIIEKLKATITGILYDDKA